MSTTETPSRRTRNAIRPTRARNAIRAARQRARDQWAMNRYAAAAIERFEVNASPVLMRRKDGNA